MSLAGTDWSNDLQAWVQQLLTTARNLPELHPECIASLSNWVESHFTRSPDGIVRPTESSNGLDILQLCQKTWCFISREVLLPPPSHSLSTHQALLAAVYAPWPRQSLGPHPVWSPSYAHLADHNVVKFLHRFTGDEEFERSRGGSPADDWQRLHAFSLRQPERFWRAVLLHTLALPLHQQPTRILAPAANPDQCVWLPGARMNIAWCALHAPRGHLADADAQPAIMWAEEAHPSQLHSISRLQLRALALHVAACLRQRLKPGDPVALILPMTPLGVAAYLGCVLAGCPVVSIPDSFAAHEIEARLRISHTQLVITQDVIHRGGKPLPLLPRVLGSGKAPPLVVVNGGCDVTPLLNYPWDGSAPSQAAQGSHSTHGGPHGNLQRSPTTTTDRLKRQPLSGNGSGSGSGRRQGQTGQGHTITTLRECDMTWEQFMVLADPQDAQHAAFQPAGSSPACLHVASSQEATNILFSSGTTGEPKAIIWDHVVPLRSAVDGWAHQNIHPGDRVCWPTSLGWMMGPWLVYASLFNGGCITLYSGAPLGRDFGEFLSSVRVNVLGLVPSIVRAWRHSGCMEGLDWPYLHCISSTGEASAPDDYHWLYALTRYRAPIIEYCGGTELGGSYLTGTSMQYACPSTFSTPSIGTQIVLLATAPQEAASKDTVEVDGRQVVISPHAPGAAPVVGEVAVVAPSVGHSQRLLNKDHYKVYYEGMPIWPAAGRPLRRHGDELCRLPGGYYTALGRVDDTMNLGGIKVASVELERAVMEKVEQVVEAAAVSLPNQGGGPEQLVLFVVLRKDGAAANSSTSKDSDSAGPASLLSQCQAAIRTELNPLFKIERVVVLPSLPRNASNKLMRRTLRDQLLQQQQQQRSKL